MERKISLCVIAGNVERYIDRFLESFSKVADEINVVSAIGNQEADETIKIAKARGCNVGRFFNGSYVEIHGANGMIGGGNSGESCQWPHVDNFAAARNLSYSMADHEWIMWADTDDVISEEDAIALRAHLQTVPDDVDCVMMPYDVPDDGLCVMRERLTRRGVGKWESPIHEHLMLPEGSKCVEFTGAKILHLPVGPRTENNERNLRILESIPEDEKTMSHRFHQFQSLRAVGRIGEAGAYAVDILTRHDKELGKAEKYELLIACGQLSGDVPTRAQFMLQAIGCDPSRREAYGELALAKIGMDENEDALALTSVMLTIPEPEAYLWNARRKYYGWQGFQLHGMALRRNKRYFEADAIQTNHFIRNGAKISLIHATRGRIKMALDCMREWYNKAENPDAIEHIYALDADDEHAHYLTVYNHVALPNGDGGPVAGWNLAARKSCGEILVQLSDDWTPPLHWDRMILDAIGDREEAVLRVSDGTRKDGLLCMAIMTRARYERQGFMFHPRFFSMYSDNYFTAQAELDDVVIDASGIVFEHKHPAFGKGEMDETYARSNAAERYAEGKAIYDELMSQQTQ